MLNIAALSFVKTATISPLMIAAQMMSSRSSTICQMSAAEYVNIFVYLENLKRLSVSGHLPVHNIGTHLCAELKEKVKKKISDHYQHRPCDWSNK